MAKIYAKQIKLGSITLDEVPQRWQNAVEALLDEQYMIIGLK